MKCPFCKKDDDRVIDSRPAPDGIAIRRRRECTACGWRFTTYERIEGTSIKVVKRDGSREPFDREKLKRGLERACWKRPISGDQLDILVSNVEERLNSRFDSEIKSAVLGEMILRELRFLDQVAFVRFASVYRQFQNFQDFINELHPLLNDEPAPDDFGPLEEP